MAHPDAHWSECPVINELKAKHPKNIEDALRTTAVFRTATSGDKHYCIVERNGLLKAYDPEADAALMEQRGWLKFSLPMDAAVDANGLGLNMPQSLQTPCVLPARSAGQPASLAATSSSSVVA